MSLYKKFVKRLCHFVPRYTPPCGLDKSNFAEFLRERNDVLVLTGAGVSTESGIPDYRSEEVGIYNRSNYKPINYSTFLKSKDARIRYWARNYIGWPSFSTKEPNYTHKFLAFLQRRENKISGIVTQNVDGLHHKGGSSNVIELHGNAFWVQCLNCSNLIWRQDFQKILDHLNPNISNEGHYAIRPDGDVEISEEVYKTFEVPDCEKCGGILKPTIVFFGENIPKARVKKVEELVEKSSALLIMGTTLSTLSSSRIVTQALELGIFICIVNIGPTKLDKKADLIFNCNCSEIFPDRLPNFLI